MRRVGSPPHSERLLEALQAAGRPSQLVLVPLATHCSDYHFSGAFGQISTYAVERLLHAVMH